MAVHENAKNILHVILETSGSYPQDKETRGGEGVSFRA